MKLFKICSMLMALLFLYSASVQLNDADWYFWFPLYALACAVNLHRIKKIAKLALCLGMLLFVKVVVEDCASETAGFWSLDLSHRVVREKIGSGLVVISMLLHIQASSSSTNSENKKPELCKSLHYGMALLVLISYGLPLVFFVIQKGEIQL